jgi:hypothetical protein
METDDDSEAHRLRRANEQAEALLNDAVGKFREILDDPLFFQLTPPSVNSMLGRLEQRGFIRRVPGMARGIELILDAEKIPPLARPFKLL